MDNKENKIFLILAKKTTENIGIGKTINIIQEQTVERQIIDEIKILDILSGIGIKKENTIIYLIVSILKLNLLLVKNSGAFLIGEQSTGKSFLYSFFLKEKCKKISGNITLANLRGDSRSSTPNEKCLYEEDTVVFEELLDGVILNGDIVGSIKDCMENGSFLYQNKQLKLTNTSFLFTGNDYTSFKKFTDITSQKILEILPNQIKDRAFFDRISIILPHYVSLFGNVKYIDKEDYILPIKDIEKIIDEIRKLDTKFLLDDFSEELEGREIKIFNKFIFSLSCLFFPKRNYQIPLWFIEGWLEFLKYFRSLLIGNYHNPFNKNSVKLILYLASYNFNEIEYVAFDNEDRLIIKLINKEVFHKIALTGFGIESNKIEMNYLKSNPNSGILSIINLLNNDTLLIQESGEYLFDNRIYLNNIREQNNSFNKTDDEYNELVLEKLARGENGVSFRGIPKFYKKGLLLRVQNIFGEAIESIELEDFCFEKTEIKILNFAKYLKKI